MRALRWGSEGRFPAQRLRGCGGAALRGETLRGYRHGGGLVEVPPDQTVPDTHRCVPLGRGGFAGGGCSRGGCPQFPQFNRETEVLRRGWCLLRNTNLSLGVEESPVSKPCQFIPHGIIQQATIVSISRCRISTLQLILHHSSCPVDLHQGQATGDLSYNKTAKKGLEQEDVMYSSFTFLPEQKGLLHVSGDFWGSAWGDSLRGEAAHPSAGFASRFLLVNTGCGRFALDRWFFIGGGINTRSH
nr:uncharacterized protein LOC106014446 isoform X2 [Anas platyrhynchos]